MYNFFIQFYQLTFKRACSIIEIMGLSEVQAHQTDPTRNEIQEVMTMADFMENDMGADLYTLVDEEGVEQTFELMDTYESEDGELYYALVPYYENPEEMAEADTELVILRSEEDENGEEALASIDDDDEYERIGQIFMDRLSEIYDDE